MTIPTGILFNEPRAKPLSIIGAIQPGAYYQFYTTNTTTPANVYADGALTSVMSQTPGTGGTTAASDGRLVPIYLNPTTIYRVQLYSAAATLLEDTDPYVLPTNTGLAPWSINEATFAPALHIVSGSVTQALQGATYSQIGNVLTFSLRINWSAIASPVGNVSVTGLPKVAVSAGPDYVFPVYFSGLTVATGSIVAFLQNGTGTMNLYNIQTATTQVQGSTLGSSGTIIISGSYQV